MGYARAFVVEVEQVFTLLMIAEHFDESLILLRRLLSTASQIQNKASDPQAVCEGDAASAAPCCVPAGARVGSRAHLHLHPAARWRNPG